MAAPPPILQTIPPRWAHFCLDIERFLTRDLGLDLFHGSIVIALSGGADSTALLVTLALLTPRLSLTLHPAHLDHGIRPESASERETAQALCQRLGLTLTWERQDVPALAARSGLGLEEAGRQARYAFLESVRTKHDAQWIALGHQLDDLAEDQLLRLVRGTGWPALAGMRAVCPERRLVRPLLLTPRQDLEAFLAALGFTWVTDPSNADPQYRRNRMRHQALPLLLAENPKYLENAAGLWRLARLDQEHWDAVNADILAQLEPALSANEPLLLHGEIIIKLDSASRLRLYKHLLDSMGPGQALQPTLFLLDQAWQEGRPGRRFQFPGAKTVELTREGLLFRATDPGESSGATPGVEEY